MGSAAKNCLKMPKIVLVPYPAQGHVTPMLKFGLAMLSRGFQPIMVTPEFIHRRLIATSTDTNGIQLMSIPDGLDLGGAGAPDFFAIEKAMEEVMPSHLERLLFQEDEDGGVVCVVIDLLASWAIEVANRCGIPAAGFWTAMLATYRLIAAIPDMVHVGLISDTGLPKNKGTACFLPDQPTLSTEFFPWLIGTQAARKGRFKFWTTALDRSRTLRWLLLNSFSEEHENSDDDHNQQNDLPKIFPVGPFNKHLAIKNPSFWKEDASCLEWLDNQNIDSVIYVSFGSWVSPIGESKVRSLAATLESLGRPFIWVLGAAWREGIPDGYLDSVLKQGKVVSWAPQMQVLQHKAVGFFLTHCGWNSTMEAIQCRRRLLCYPVAGDQFINCYYITHVWKIGARIEGFEQGDLEEGLTKLSKDSEINGRLSRLHERTMGEEARGKIMANLTALSDDLNGQTSETP
ncbi:hypothetical protein SLEP1_g26084 [Rubroshorea leprosula]|uniref:Glycosyltransferase n=1 Tax=Rubroshorea leprosula TaxID=152421 RepID=A0AAV5JS88_9ROSI|nr:hypothetical protein SLEP1_g26084 [Rubroshorea leprosula]